MGIYWTNSGKRINTRVVQKSSNVLHLSVENMETGPERRRCLKMAAGIFFAFFWCLLANGWLLSPFHCLFLVPLVVIAYCYTGVVRSENLILVKDYALQYSTTFAGGTVRNTLIPIKHIQDVVINEVFYNLKVIFILQILTKGNLYRRKPIVTVLNHLNPRLDCLEFIYNEIHSILDLEND